MASGKSIYTVQTANKAFEILEFMSDCPTGATLRTVASKVGLTSSKTLRLLATLCERGLIEKETPSGTYNLGLNSFSLAQKLLKNSSVINLAHPVIEQLAKKHGEAVYITVINGEDVLFLDMADCNQQIKAVPLVGKTFPCSTNAAGKVMKPLEATEPDEWQGSMKPGNNGNDGNTASPVTGPRTIGSNGEVAVDVGGLGEGIISIAVAVKDYAGHVVGAITMLGPSFRLVRKRIETEIIPSLIEGAALASAKFGYLSD